MFLPFFECSLESSQPMPLQCHSRELLRELTSNQTSFCNDSITFHHMSHLHPTEKLAVGIFEWCDYIHPKLTIIDMSEGENFNMNLLPITNHQSHISYSLLSSRDYGTIPSQSIPHPSITSTPQQHRSEAHTVSYSSLLNQHTPSFSTQEIIAHQQKSIITHQKNHDKLSVLYCHCLSNAIIPTQTPGMGSKNWGTY